MRVQTILTPKQQAQTSGLVVNTTTIVKSNRFEIKTRNYENIRGFNQKKNP